MMSFQHVPVCVFFELYNLFDTVTFQTAYICRLNIIKNFDKRRSLTKFQSAHRLKIERGRFSKPPIPVENRFCDHCLSKIEDEFQFLIKCSKYNSPRNNLFSVVQINCRNFCSFEDKVKFNWLLTNSDKNVIIELSKDL